MNKYGEIMEHIEVTEEMRERILRNTEQALAEARKSAARRRRYTAFAAAAAALVLVCGVTLWNNSRLVTPPEDSATDGMQAIYDAREYETLTDLAEAAGFSVPELQTLPFTVVQTDYVLITGDLVEVIYTGSSDTERLTLRKSPGTEDNSGDYNTYAVTETAAINDLEVTLKGDSEDSFSLALWNDGEYSYSIGLFSGCSREALLDCVSEAVGND